MTDRQQYIARIARTLESSYDAAGSLPELREIHRDAQRAIFAQEVFGRTSQRTFALLENAIVDAILDERQRRVIRADVQLAAARAEAFVAPAPAPTTDVVRRAAQWAALLTLDANPGRHVEEHAGDGDAFETAANQQRDDELVTIAEVAALLALHERTLLPHVAQALREVAIDISCDVADSLQHGQTHAAAILASALAVAAVVGAK